MLSALINLSLASSNNKLIKAFLESITPNNQYCAFLPIFARIYLNNIKNIEH